MLVLSRKSRQTVIIDGRVSVTVLEVRGNKVTVVVRAPDRIRIAPNTLASELGESTHRTAKGWGSVVRTMKKDDFIGLFGLGEFTVVEVRGDRVRLGFTVDEVYPIHRLEVYRHFVGTAFTSHPLPVPAAA